jgi:fermentation-respiration switch protein FrsA (DUF1100 family)
MQRKDVTFVCGTDTCAAWLYAPADGGSDGTVPLIVMAHGLTGTRRDRLGPFAERFAEARVAACSSIIAASATARGSPTTSTRRRNWRTGAHRSLTRAPEGVVRTYPGVAHFDIYDGPEHEAVVADEVAFLRQHLLPST